MKRTHRFLSIFLALVLLVSPVLHQRTFAAEALASVAETVSSTEDTAEYLTLAQAGELIRTCMAARENVPAFKMILEEPRYLATGEVADILFAEVFRHTGVPGQGDELKWVYSGYSYPDSTDDFDGSVHKLSFDGIDFNYYSTSEQEQILNERIDQLMLELDIANKSDFEKIETLYDYVCQHVSYADEYLNGELVEGTEAYNHIFTAYGALINGSAVCQGFASLMYRLLLEAGIDNRFLAGENHGWNAAKLGDMYYILDSTSDYGQETYRNFLIGSASYNHFPDITPEVMDTYPISALDYGAAQPDPDAVLGSGSCGDNVTWALTGDGTLTISGTGAMTDFAKNQAPWSELTGYANKVVIENGVTSIGQYAFYNCLNLTQVVFPESSLDTIGAFAFLRCIKLETIDLPDSVQTVSGGAFTNCTQLKEVTLSDGMTEIATELFSYCSSLVTVNIPEGITVIGQSAFLYCSALESVTIPDTVTTLGNYAFASAFTGETETILVIPESVTEVGSKCLAWSNLSRVIWNANVTQVGDEAFYLMPYLKKVELNGPVTGIGEYAFQHCVNLEEVALPEGLTTLGRSAFNSCTALKQIDLPDTLENIPHAAFGQCKSLESVTIPALVTVIEESAFSGCTGLKSVIISEGVQEIQRAAFFGCTALEEVTFLGDAPSIFDALNYCVFAGVSCIVYYPYGNDTWTPEVRLNYGGALRWIALEENHTAHTPDVHWYSNDSGHWQWCTGCLEYTSLGVHTYENCQAMECSSCGYTRTSDQIQQEEHDWTQAGCTTLPSCKLCGEIGGSTLGHSSSGMANCVQKEVCTRCGEVLTEKNPSNHTETLQWVLSETQHWYGYPCCDKTIVATEDHEWDWGACSECGYVCIHDNPDATCLDEAVCSICGLSYGGENHAGTAIWKTSPYGHNQVYSCCSIVITIVEDHAWSGGVCTECGYSCRHLGGTATCTDKAVCQYCGESYGSEDTSNHTGTAEWTQTGTHHSKEYDCCGAAMVALEAHEWNGNVCTECGYVGAVSSHTVTWIVDGEETTEIYEYGAAITPPADPAKDGYVFTGWSPEVPANMPNSDLTFTAQWKRVNPFSDVYEGKFYYDAVLWAVEEGITNGYTDGTFRTDKACTRAEVVTFLWRAAGCPVSTGANSFPDVEDGKYYTKAVVWAAENGITAGYRDGTFKPGRTCTRAEIVTFLWRAAGKPAPTVTEHPFTDIDENGYYYNAILWAKENNITQGKTATTFQPAADCTRAQIVTFLYRMMVGQGIELKAGQ